MKMAFTKLKLQPLCKMCESVRLVHDLLKPKPRIARHLIIKCKHQELNHFSDMHYNALDSIPLASKGWMSKYSRGDYFTVLPTKDGLLNESFSMDDANINPKLIENLKKMEIYALTKFQMEGIPCVMHGKHVLLAAETGCGKTVTYLIPIIQNLVGRIDPKLNRPGAVVIIPNRELAYQVGTVAESLSQGLNFKIKVIVGGNTKRLMLNPEFNEIDLLIATPGVLGKLCSVGIYKLDDVLYTVLDEADTLMDDSFAERMTGIIRRVPQSQIILVSATKPQYYPTVLDPIRESLIEIVSPKTHRPLMNITQKFLRLRRSEKPSNLLEIAHSTKMPMIVFSNRNATCDWLAMFLRENKISCANINGNMNHAIRIEQWNTFMRGEARILSSTDIGSRGLNTIQVKHVLNYDFPIYAADYLHRVGRVGRLGSLPDCKATNFISGPEEVQLVQEIELAIRKNKPLFNVNGNITKLIQNKIAFGMKSNV